METISGRVPDELYQWFASLKVEGAPTSSDKLRMLLAQLKRQHEGSVDYVSAHTWFRDMISPLQRDLASLAHTDKVESDVLNTAIEHVAALAATLLSARTATHAAGVAVEDAVVRRLFVALEALLRQAVTPTAAALDPKVVRRHATRCVELARIIG